ncbi:magnesium chelatase [Candidatus Campbellbacteria bacterium CG22_combo_CG10-13_8_21_14_all_36_13]|uniref:Magnesium chelatase n=1 Tax=Candidatus Campbellbacteria bacterium CG22_combo_CG10-13_8_21_14_all_36_13 TaxID=1974529 RepID=A0A2H0DYT8_9BACT|nr:MAG: magnesium chelatase [Candidatus Campbellbacteria bacterium CG22_combo_CG10-13_8_21_14_all_36_13]
MSFAKVYSAHTILLDAQIITVEVDIIVKSLQAFTIVGLPDKAVEESRDRVSAAIGNSDLPSPKKQNSKVIVSLAPADVKKEGPSFDLAIALAYLLAYKDPDTGERVTTFDPTGKIFLGELSLDGKLRRITGVLPLVIEAKKRGFTDVFLPKENTLEAALIDGINVYGAETLNDVIDHLNDEKKFTITKSPKTKISTRKAKKTGIEFDDIKGNSTAKRGLLIAAAGGHNIALYGPPGTGKTMLARAFTGILPPLSFDDALEVTGIHSIAGKLKTGLILEPPFRSPHHTSSYVAIIGGGVNPKPGEVTLAHKGVLFLDEFPEFDRRVVETLRQPLEDAYVSISRAKGSAEFPARFILVASMNPCPCGNRGSKKECICTPMNIERYKRKLSGPIVDRIDMWIEVSKVEYKDLSERTERTGEGDKLRKEVEKAHAIAQKRFEKYPHIKTNGQMNARNLLEIVELSPEVKKILNEAAEKHNMSARGYHRTIKLARTIADIEGSLEIKSDNILEALQYRYKEM